MVGFTHSTVQNYSRKTEKGSPSFIYRAETVKHEQSTESDADSESTINYSTIADNQPIIPDLQPCQQRNISSAPVQKISENFFSARNITVVKQRPKT